MKWTKIPHYSKDIITDLSAGINLSSGDSLLFPLAMPGLCYNILTMEKREGYPMKVGIITASDKGAAGQREDLSGPAIEEMIREIGGEVAAYEVVPDEFDALKAAMIHMADDLHCNLIFTTGGTGFSKRDVTPEATLAVMERNAPGIAEAMRAASLQITNRAMLTRAVSVIRGDSIIINLPGSPKGVRECLQVILPALPHGVEILTGQASECARPG
jgi:molybdopterin adenylyltransferase